MPVEGRNGRITAIFRAAFRPFLPPTGIFNAFSQIIHIRTFSRTAYKCRRLTRQRRRRFSRVEYALTPQGESFVPILLTMKQWGEKELGL